MTAAEGAVRRLPGRILASIQRHVPTREAIEASPMLRPLAGRILRPSLWRFNRRSVPRGVAVGLATSVLIPVAHMPAAAILSVPFRANLPTAVGITIPSTFAIPAIWWAAYRIGGWALRVDRAVPGAPLANNIRANSSAFHWLFAQAGPATVVGLLILAVTGAAGGYFAAKLGWRWRVVRRWRRRRAKEAGRRAASEP